MSCCFTKRKRVANCYSSDEENALPTKTDDVSIFAHTIFYVCMYICTFIHTFVANIAAYAHTYICVYIYIYNVFKIN